MMGFLLDIRHMKHKATKTGNSQSSTKLKGSYSLTSIYFIIMIVSSQFVITRSFHPSARRDQSRASNWSFVVNMSPNINPPQTILSMSSPSSPTSSNTNNDRGKILVLGGTGFLGQTICRRATAEGYSVTSMSRRGLPEKSNSMATLPTSATIDYRIGDARQKDSISNILDEGGYVGTCIFQMESCFVCRWYYVLLRMPGASF